MKSLMKWLIAFIIVEFVIIIYLLTQIGQLYENFTALRICYSAGLERCKYPYPF